MSWFNSRRSDVMALNGAVATSQPLAAQAGLNALRSGGNAVDAAVCAAATLCVVEPMSTGVGGDLFALVWSAADKKVFALNASGRSPLAANAADVKKRGLSAIPLTASEHAALAVSVPGQVAGWHDLLTRFGSQTLKTALRPAIEYAESGFPVSEIIAANWAQAAPKLQRHPSGAELLSNGSAPITGQTMRLPTLARTLRVIADGGADAFYKGELARRIADFTQKRGGWLTDADLADHRSEWVAPISVNYRGVDVWECPPNGQGLVTLLALNMLENFDVSDVEPQSAQRYHWLIEVTRRAFADGLAHIADPAFADIPLKKLLSKDYARAAEIDASRAANAPSAPAELGEDTVYVTVVDGEGNACSLISSLFYGFGTGLVAPETGVALQSRGALFSLDPRHPNYLQGGKRPYQTIIPALATHNGELWLSFGVMGGYQQPQGQLQVLSNMIDYGMAPQAALDALRYSVDVTGDGAASVEEGLPDDVFIDLQTRGHKLKRAKNYERLLFGGGQIVRRDPDSGVLTAASEPRKDGCAVGW